MTKDSIESTILGMINKLGGLDKFQNNPMAFIGELFQHPELLGELDQMSKTPEMQQQIAESMNNPAFQQMVGNNPLLSGLMQDYQSKKGHTQGGVSPQTQKEESSQSMSEEESEDTGSVGQGCDLALPNHQRIDWLNPQSITPFFISENPEERRRFSDLLAKLPASAREKVEIIAEKRLHLHLNSAQMSHLESIADRYALLPLDLMSTQGGFVGEVFYCASLLLPNEDLRALAKDALACLHCRSGYPVASYLTQILLYLDSYDDISRQDWENFVWALSGTPQPGRDGNFSIRWDDACLIAEIAAANLEDDIELYLGVVLGLLGWPALDIKGIQTPLQTILQTSAFPKDILKARLMRCLEGEKIYAISLLKMRSEVRHDAIAWLVQAGELTNLLKAAANWPITHASSAAILVDKLDLQWSKVDADIRDAFLHHALEMDSESLAKSALRVGVAWQPEKYRLLALDSPYPKIKQWAEGLNK
ncbi:MAG: hypothetical protein FWC40_03955 [Proteobacteria bacterium]|nr:hypothetical protein [Pseudomonadota bacterium]